MLPENRRQWQRAPRQAALPGGFYSHSFALGNGFLHSWPEGQSESLLHAQLPPSHRPIAHTLLLLPL